MPVTSSTIGGVNTWTVSGAVTDADFKTAWAGLIVNGVYVINRAIYLDETADLTGCTGGFLVDFGTQVLPGFILHTARDRTKSTFKNFTFLQRTGLSVADRLGFVQTWDGTTLVVAGGGLLSTDGLSQSGGGMIYGVPGNPGGADPRYLNAMAFAGLENATIYSQEFAEQELQICVGTSVQLKGLNFEKCFGFPQIGTPAASVNAAVYRSTQNTQITAGGGQYPIRLFPIGGRYASVCYVDSYVTRNNEDILVRLADGYGSDASNPVCVMILNNYTRGSWFGTTKTNMPVANWVASNLLYGGVLKKIQFVNGDGGIVRCYDSRSTAVAQKCKFVETGSFDFLDTDLAPTVDAEGKIALVHIGAIATGSTAAIARYTGQKYTFQKFGYRVIVGTPDMTSGDNDLSAFTPVILTEQDALVRTQAEISAATTIASFQDLLEELHVLSIGLSGAASYDGAHGGNLFNFAGGVLTTSFASVVVDATAASKISFNSATNSLTINAGILTDTETVQRWDNVTGPVTLQNGASIEGVYSSSEGTFLPPNVVTVAGITAGSRLQIYNVTTATEVFNGIVAGTTYTATYEEGTGYSEGDSVRIRLVYANGATAKQEFPANAIAGASGWSLLVEQIDNDVYNSFGIDGSTITQFQADYLTDQVDVVVGTNFNLSTFYAWWMYNLTTEDGIRDFFGGITAEDQANFRINTAVLSLFLDNSTNTNIRQLDNRRFYRSDGAYPVLDPTSGGGGIDIVWRNQIFIAETGTSGLTASESALLSDIATLATSAQLSNAQSSIESDIAALNNVSTSDIQTAATAALNAYDGPTKAEFDAAISSISASLSDSDVQSIASAVELSILDENDGNTILQAIVDAIGNENIDEVALVAAIRADLERAGGSLDNIINNFDSSQIELTTNLRTINKGVKNASFANGAIPHTDTF